MQLRLLGALVLCLLAAAAHAAGPPAPPRPTFFAPQVAPDGSRVLWESLERGGSLWLTPPSGGEPTFVMNGHSPSWDGPGAVRFLVSRDDGHQVLESNLWRMDLDDGAVTLLARDVGNPDYAPPASVSATPAATPTAASPLAGQVLCVDPGHGLETGAPCAFTGVREDVYVLESSYVVKDWLQAAGATVKLTRIDGSTNPSLPARVNFSNACGAKAFVAVHYNSAVNAAARGLEVFHRDGDGTSRDVARAVHDAIRAATALPTRGVKADKASLGFYLGVLSTAHQTSRKTLTEGLFLSNAEDAARIADPRFTEEVSWGIYAGLSRSLGVEPSPLPTAPPATVTLGTPAPGAGPWMGPAPVVETMDTPSGLGSAAVLASAERPLTALRAGGSDWADYRVMAAARRLSGDGAYGLVARCNQVSEDQDRLVGWALLVDEKAARASLVLCAGRVEDGLVLATGSLPAPAGAWRRLVLECRGEAVTASVDGEALTPAPVPAGVRAAAPRTGRAGAWLRDGRVALDHLAVEPPPAPAE